MARTRSVFLSKGGKSALPAPHLSMCIWLGTWHPLRIFSSSCLQKCGPYASLRPAERIARLPNSTSSISARGRDCGSHGDFKTRTRETSKPHFSSSSASHHCLLRDLRAMGKGWHRGGCAWAQGISPSFLVSTVLPSPRSPGANGGTDTERERFQNLAPVVSPSENR